MKSRLKNVPVMLGRWVEGAESEMVRLPGYPSCIVCLFSSFGGVCESWVIQMWLTSQRRWRLDQLNIESEVRHFPVIADADDDGDHSQSTTDSFVIPPL